MKLYRSANYATHWFAFQPAIGWVTFPAEIAGWRRRSSAALIDETSLFEVPIWLGFNTGIPGAPSQYAEGPSAYRVRKAA